MAKLVNVNNFAVTALPGDGGSWPTGMLRDSFQQQKARRGLKEDRSGSLSCTVETALGAYVGDSVDATTLTDAAINRLLAECIIPSFTPDQLQDGSSLRVAIQGEGSGGGGYVDLTTFTVIGTGENTDPFTLKWRPSADSTVQNIRLEATRSSKVSAKKSQLEMRVYYDAEQVRDTRYLTSHRVVKSASTVNSAFQAFLNQNYMTSPVVYHGVDETEGSGVKGKTYAGPWVINRVEVNDNQDATSLVRVSMEQAGAWRDV